MGKINTKLLNFIKLNGSAKPNELKGKFDLSDDELEKELQKSIETGAIRKNKYSYSYQGQFLSIDTTHNEPGCPPISMEIIQQGYMAKTTKKFSLKNLTEESFEVSFTPVKNKELAKVAFFMIYQDDEDKMWKRGRTIPKREYLQKHRITKDVIAPGEEKKYCLVFPLDLKTTAFLTTQPVERQGGWPMDYRIDAISLNYREFFCRKAMMDFSLD